MPELTAVGVPASDLEKAMGIEVVEATPQRVVGSIPVDGNTQPFGVLHGGASCVLAETLASVGACLHFGQSGQIAVGTEINATHHAPARGGRVTGVATAVHLGHRLASYEIVLTDENGRRVCTARMTAAGTDAKASGPGAASQRTAAQRTSTLPRKEGER